MSSSHCAAARPMVPPKPDKDKQEEQAINTWSPSSSSRVSTEEQKKTTTTSSSSSTASSVRQTIGTQVNMLNKSQSSAASASSSVATGANLSTGTSPGKPWEFAKSPPGVKPALPPKPKSGLITSPRKPPVSLPTSPAPQKLPNESPKTCDTPKCPEAAPVARLDEFEENLNDLSSPASAGKSRPLAKPSSLNANVSKLKPPVSPTTRSTSPSSGRNCIQIPSAFNKVQNSSPKSPAQSSNLSSPNSNSVQRSPNPPSLPKPLLSPQEIALRQTKSASLGRNFNFTQLNNNVSVSKKSTTLARVLPLDLNWGKSTNFGAHTSPTFASGTSTTTGSRIGLGTGIGPRTSPGQHIAPHTAPAVPNRPLNFPRPVSFAPSEALLNSVPPPPPPRMKKAQKSLSLGSPPTSPTSPALSPSLSAKPVVYATVDKEKKWAERLQKKLEQEQQQQPELGDGIQTAAIEEEPLESLTQPLESWSQPLESLSNSPSSVNNNLNLNVSTTEEIKPQSSVTESSNAVTESSSAVPKTMSTEDTSGEVEKVEETVEEIGTCIRSSLTVTTSWLAKLIDAEVQSDLGNIINHIDTQTDVIQMDGPTSPESSTTALDDKSCDKRVVEDNKKNHDPLGRNESYLFAIQAAKLRDGNLAAAAAALSGNQASPNLLADIIEQLKPKEFNSHTILSGCSSPEVPPRVSVPDEFELELENQLESQEAKALQLASATFTEADEKVKLLREKYVKQKAFQEHRSFEESKELKFRGQMNSNLVSNGSEAKDPRAYLQLVDARLHSMQTLLANFSCGQSSQVPQIQIHEESSEIEQNSEQDSRQIQESNGNVSESNGNVGESNGNVGESNENGESNGNVSESNGNIEESNGNAEVSSSPRQSDGEIISNILLSSKRFENKLARRMSTDNKLDNNNSETPLPCPTQRQVSMDESFLRRSWTCSDYSPSPSESSSSSSVSHPHPPHHHHHNNTSTIRRKQSSWVDEDEDLSTGALGDAESSDAPASNEDIQSSLGKQHSNKKKRGISSIFSSFGKGEPEAQPPRRSQFFVQESHRRDRTGSLPAGRSLSIEESSMQPQVKESKRSPHRPLVRSAGSATALIHSTAAIASVPTSVDSSNPASANSWMDSASNSASGCTSTSALGCASNSASGSVSNSASGCASGCASNSASGCASGCTPNSASGCAPSPASGCVSNPWTISASISTENNSSIPKGYEDVLAELEDASQRKSFFVAREILTSERTFVDVLNLLTIDFPNAVKAASETQRMGVIGKADLDFILGGLPILKAVNEVLVSELEKRIPRWKESPKVADIIVKNGPFLKHYSTYVRDFERIMQKLDHCCAKYSAFARTVREFEATERCMKLGLKHYMLKPVQRMPQYRLLLEDYLKTLTEESEDYCDTIKAIAIVKEVAEHANEAINLQITNEKLVNLQNRLPNSVVLKPNRLLIKEGELLKVCRKELQPRYFALMTDCLLCMTYNASSGAPSMKDLKLRYELALAGMRISLPASESYSNEFSVISTARSFNLVAKTGRERDEWMKAISSAIQENIRKRACNSPDLEREFRIGHEAPVWIQDKRVTMCQVCTAEFTVTFRRHHCRACGKVVCSNCSGNQAPLYYHNNDAARVCDDCYQYLLEEFDRENREKMTDEVEELRSRFKKLLYNTTGRKSKKAVPDVFKSPANNSGCQISGYLNWKERKAWKRQWFVLMDRVLYVYAASEDIVAVKTIPVLGYQVEPVSEENTPGCDGLVFRLTHIGQNPILFAADNTTLTEKWIAAIQEATVLT